MPMPTMATRRTVHLLKPLEDQAGVGSPAPALEDIVVLGGSA
jgi:hypothetical protein